MFGQSKSYHNRTRIKTVSITEQLRLYYLGVLYMFWILLKLVLRSIWQYFFAKTTNSMIPGVGSEYSDRPPAFLIDSSCGFHSYMKLKTVKFHYVEAGCNSSPLIILLHGFPDCWYGWRFQIEQLSQYFHVISLDLKGFGESEKPLCKNSYRIDSLLNELKQSIEILKGSRPCSLIGHDLGALLGWFLITENPDLCASFVSVCGPHPNFYWNHSSTHTRLLNDQWIGFVQIPLVAELEIFHNRNRILSELFAHLDPEKSAIFPAYTYMFSRRQDWIGPLNYFRNLPFLRLHVQKEPKITIPVMLVAGKSDKISQLDDIVTSTDYCDNFIVKIIENSGHCPHQENPQLFNSLLLEFLVQKVHADSNNLHANQQSFTGDLLQKMFSAVSSTVKIGSNVIDTVQKRTISTNKMVPVRILNLGYD